MAKYLSWSPFVPEMISINGPDHPQTRVNKKWKKKDQLISLENSRRDKDW